MCQCVCVRVCPDTVSAQLRPLFSGAVHGKQNIRQCVSRVKLDWQLLVRHPKLIKRTRTMRERMKSQPSVCLRNKERENKVEVKDR